MRSIAIFCLLYSCHTCHALSVLVSSLAASGTFAAETSKMDPTMLVWMLRIQETENLLNKRKADLEAQQLKRQELEKELEAEQQQHDLVLQELAGVHASIQGLTRDKLQLKQDCTAARDILQDELKTAGLMKQQRQLQEQLSRLAALTQGELSLQQQYEEVINSHMQDKGQQTRELQEKARKWHHKLEALQQQEDKMCLAQHLEKLTQKQQQLQDEVQQLTSTLTNNKQANVLARAKVAAAVSSTESELKTGQERCAELKRKAFEMKRQQAVNTTRLKHLEQDSNWLQQQCSELDQLIARASATIDQLASCCDL